MRHPHADVLIAIAEGREVQRRSADHLDWKDVAVTNVCNPLYQGDWQWRVKPQKHKRWVNIYYTNLFEKKEHADDGASSFRIACIEIEFEEGEGLK